MHPPLTLHRHPMCADEYASFNISDLGFYNLAASRVIMLRSGEIWNNPQVISESFSFLEIRVVDGSDRAIFVMKIIEEFQKCHADHPIAKFFGECTELKIKLDRCFRQEKALKRKANFEESKKVKERLQAYRKDMAEKDPQ